MGENLNFGMKRVTRPEDIRKLGTILSVWAHPDDETFTCGGLMALAARNGQRVVCVTATKGEKGVQDEARWPAERLGDIRAKELTLALNHLGLREHHWLDFVDGEMDQVADEEGAARVAHYIDLARPDTILTFPPDGITGHPDHKAINRWVDVAARRSGSKADIFHAADTQENFEEFLEEADRKVNIYFAVDRPNLVPEADCDLCVCLPGVVLDRKIEALRCMPSQTEALFISFGDDWARKAFAQETFVRAGNP